MVIIICPCWLDNTSPWKHLYGSGLRYLVWDDQSRRGPRTSCFTLWLPFPCLDLMQVHTTLRKYSREDISFPNSMKQRVWISFRQTISTYYNTSLMFVWLTAATTFGQKKYTQKLARVNISWPHFTSEFFFTLLRIIWQFDWVIQYRWVESKRTSLCWHSYCSESSDKGVNKKGVVGPS